MQTNPSTDMVWASIGTLIVAIAVLHLANGFLGTLISLRVQTEGFAPEIVGLVLAGCFMGYTAGALRAPHLIRRIGHIRAFAVFAGGAAACVVVMPLLIGPWFWTAARMIIGFCCAGLFIAVESWLNAKAEPASCGRVFAVYMVALYAALACGQLLLGEIDPASVGAFNLVTCLFGVALVMVAATPAGAPQLDVSPRMPYGQLSRAVPVEVAGCAVPMPTDAGRPRSTGDRAPILQHHF